MRKRRKIVSAAVLLLFVCSQGPAAGRAVRAQDLGIPFQGTPDALNAITDVRGIEVGECTVISGSGPMVRGHGSARTGVTIIHPLGKNSHEAVAAAFSIINGTGEWTGSRMVEELGLFFGPIALTGTANIGTVHQALVDWSAKTGFVSADELIMRSLPLGRETLDDTLNDVFGHALRASEIFVALDQAHAVPVGEEIAGLLPELGDQQGPQMSGTANDLSGEFALAFSTGYRVPLHGASRVAFLVNDNDEDLCNALVAAAVQAVEEAEINQHVASETMAGANGAKVYALPHERLVNILRGHRPLIVTGAH